MDNKQIHLLPSSDKHSDADATDLRQPGSHLTDAQFTDLLLGTIPHAVTAHLEACPQCAEEAHRVSGAIGSFAQQSQLWAERRAAARPMLQPACQPLLSWLDRPAAWSAAAATLVLAEVLRLLHGGALHRLVDMNLVDLAYVRAVPQLRDFSTFNPGFLTAEGSRS